MRWIASHHLMVIAFEPRLGNPIMQTHPCPRCDGLVDLGATACNRCGYAAYDLHWDATEPVRVVERELEYREMPTCAAKPAEELTITVGSCLNLDFREVRNLATTASRLKSVAMMDHLLTFLAAQLVMLSCYILWIFLLACIITVVATAVGIPGIHAQVLTQGPALVLLCIVLWLIAASFIFLARWWRRLISSDVFLVGIVMAGAIFLVFLGVYLSAFSFVGDGLWKHSSPGELLAWILTIILGIFVGLLPLRSLVCAVTLLRTSVQSPNTTDGHFQVLADVFRSGITLESLADEHAWNRRFAGIIRVFIVASGLHVLGGFVAAFVVPFAFNSFRPDIAGTAIAGFHLLLSFCISSNLAKRIRDSRSLLATTADNVRMRDRRSPVLLLRSFVDEDRLTRSGRIQFLSLTRSSVLSLEEHLTDTLWRIGPVVAIGRPGEQAPPPGSARQYLYGTGNDHWRKYMSSVAGESAAVLAVAGRTAGLAWEMCYLQRKGLLNRLLIVLPNWLEQPQWRGFCAASGLPSPAADLPLGAGSQRVLGVRFQGNEAIVYRGPATPAGYQALSVVAVAELINFAGLPPSASPSRERLTTLRDDLESLDWMDEDLPVKAVDVTLLEEEFDV
jgi:hypothetical protein